MLYLNDKLIQDNRFPDKTALMRLPEYAVKQSDISNVTITWKYDNDAELFQLICLTKHLHEHGYQNIILKMPYIPNARMDRVKNDNEIFTLKYFAEVINSLHFKNVIVLDPHSNVSSALIDRILVVEPTYNVSKILADYIHDHDNLMMFFPDEGAMKRYANIAKMFHIPYLFGMKKRDWKTGEIQGLDVIGDDCSGKNILIIDDISSKGGTFYHSAKALKKLGANDIYLYVSHCEDTILEGELITSGLVRRIFTTSSIYRAEHELITVLYKENE